MCPDKADGRKYMAALLFDTHKAVKELQESGFDEAQAEAVVATVGTAIVGNVATKQDISELRAEMQAVELRITLRMGALIVGGVALIVALDKLL